MYNEYVILYTSNYCQKIQQYFDVEKLIEAGIKVELWNLSKLTINFELKKISTPGLVEKDIESFSVFEREIREKDLQSCLFLSYINYADFSYRVYRILSKYKVDILYGTGGTLPVGPEPVVSKIKRKLDYYSLKRYVICRIQRILLKTPLFTEAKFVLLSCRKADCDYKVSKSTEYLAYNSGDYNSCDIEKSAKKESNYIVFIDQYIPFHEEFIINGQGHIDAKNYYRSLNSFFESVESKYNCEVVICAHPSALKYEEDDFFNGRKVFFGRTSEFIRDCKGVLAQCSTALSYAVTYKKPVIIFTTKEIERKYPNFSKDTLMFSQLLNAPYVNIDETTSCGFNDIDDCVYDKYRLDYLTLLNDSKKKNFDVLISIANNNYLKYKIAK